MVAPIIIPNKHPFLIILVSSRLSTRILSRRLQHETAELFWQHVFRVNLAFLSDDRIYNNILTTIAYLHCSQIHPKISIRSQLKISKIGPTFKPPSCCSISSHHFEISIRIVTDCQLCSLPQTAQPICPWTIRNEIPESSRSHSFLSNFKFSVLYACEVLTFLCL